MPTQGSHPGQAENAAAYAGEQGPGTRLRVPLWVWVMFVILSLLCADLSSWIRTAARKRVFEECFHESATVTELKLKLVARGIEDRSPAGWLIRQESQWILPALIRVSMALGQNRWASVIDDFNKTAGHVAVESPGSDVLLKDSGRRPMYAEWRWE